MSNDLTLPTQATYLETLSAFYKLSNDIQLPEQTHSQAAILQRLQPVRQQFRASPFFTRIQDWPRGYAGDFETIEYVINGAIAPELGTFGHYAEKWLLTDCGISQQHRNKVQQQSRLILETIFRQESAAIASLGCGSCADIRAIKTLVAHRSFQLDLIDIDPGAIAFSQSHLLEVADRCTYIQGNIYRLVQKMIRKYDLIVIGGVFDYLSDKVIVTLLKKLYFENLLPGGKLFYTNLSDQDPYRVLREYFGNWPLLQRSEDNLYAQIRQAGIPVESARIDRDSTLLTYLVELVA